MPTAWKGKYAQNAGRLHRGYDGKIEAQIFDYVYIYVPVRGGKNQTAPIFMTLTVMSSRGGED